MAQVAVPGTCILVFKSVCFFIMIIPVIILGASLSFSPGVIPAWVEVVIAGDPISLICNNIYSIC